MQCITTTTFKIIINGKTGNLIQAERGIRQGDHFLHTFLLVLNILTVILFHV